MSRSVNSLTLIGHVGNDPEVRSTQGGTRVATFSLATNTQWVDEAGKKQERTQWHRVVVWDALADVVEKYVTKGKQLYVLGRVDYRQWQDKDGQTRYMTEVVAHEVVFLGGGSDSDQRTEQRAAESPEAARAAKKREGAPAATPAAASASSGKGKGKAKDGERVPF